MTEVKNEVGERKKTHTHTDTHTQHRNITNSIAKESNEKKIEKSHRHQKQHQMESMKAQGRRREHTDTLLVKLCTSHHPHMCVSVSANMDETEQSKEWKKQQNRNIFSARKIQDRIQTHMPSTNTKSIRISYFHRSQRKRERERENYDEIDGQTYLMKTMTVHVKERQRDREKIIRNMYFFHFMKLLFNNHISWYFSMEVNERLQKCSNVRRA